MKTKYWYHILLVLLIWMGHHMTHAQNKDISILRQQATYILGTTSTQYMLQANPSGNQGTYIVEVQLRVNPLEQQTDTKWNCNTFVSVNGTPYNLNIHSKGHAELQYFLDAKRQDIITDASGQFTINVDAPSITSITGTPTNPQLVVKVYEVFNQTFNPALLSKVTISKHEPIGSTPEARLVWNYIEAGVQYDVEYVYIDQYDTGFTLGDDPFEHKEPIRVTVSNQYYNLPLTFPEGNVYFRLRGVSYDATGQRITGSWQTLDTENTPNTLVVNSTGFEVDKNWQVVRAFAEHGKEKQVITYYDETLNARQTRTYLNTKINDNTDDITLVAENKYDYEGRASLQVLPFPVRGKNLNYQSGLNVFKVNTTTTTLKKSAFDNGGLGALPLDNNTGAAQYYSSNNNIGGTHRDYIPDAQGYPFVQTLFLNDNTGRVKEQSGVGTEFKLNTDHSTKYAYGTPQREELVRLFGEQNVGKISRYKKMMAVDPNGQVSVTYTTQEGQTIATALAGPAPNNLDQLASYAPTSIHVDLTKHTEIDSNTGDKVVQTTLMNTTPGTNYQFDYDAQLEPGFTYQFQVILEDPEKQVVWEVNEFISSSSYTLNHNIVLHEVGAHQLTKILRLIPENLEEIQKEIENSTDFIQYRNTTLTTYENNVDVSHCEDCANCDQDDRNQAIIQGTQGECESMLQQMIQQMNNADLNCTFTTVSDHPEYPFYQECVRHLPATQFEHTFTEEITTWQEAQNQTHDPEKLWDTDPFFDQGLYGDGREGDMKNALQKYLQDHYKTAYPNNTVPNDFKTLVDEIASFLGGDINTEEGKWNYFYGAYTKIKKDIYKKGLQDDGHLYFTTITSNNGLCANPIVQDPTTLFSETENLASQQDWENYTKGQIDEYFKNTPNAQVEAWVSQFITLCPTIETQGRIQDIRTELTAHYAIYGNTGNLGNPDKIDFSQNSTHLNNLLTILTDVGCEDIIPTIDIRSNECQSYITQDVQYNGLFGFGITGGHGLINHDTSPEYDELILSNSTGTFNLNNDFTIQFRIAGEPQWFNCWGPNFTGDNPCVAPLIQIGDQTDVTNSFFLGIKKNAGTHSKIVIRDKNGVYHDLVAIAHGSPALHGRDICSFYTFYVQEKGIGDNPITLVRKGNQLKVLFPATNYFPKSIISEWKTIDIEIPNNTDWKIGGERSMGTKINETQTQTNHFVGFLRDIRLWNRAISETENKINLHQIEYDNGLLGQWKLENQNTQEENGGTPLVSGTQSNFTHEDFTCLDVKKICQSYSSSMILPLDPKQLKEQCRLEARAHAYENAIKVIEEELDRRILEKITESKSIALGNATETFTADYLSSEHHYTLYYYDQAGSLVQTVPPAGVSTNGLSLIHI